MACIVTGAWRAHRRGAAFANPCFTQIHPTCIPVAGDYQSKLTLMSESLRNDGRIWVPKNKGDQRPAAQIPEDERDYYLERFYPSFGNLSPRDIASRRAKEMVDKGHGVGELKNGVFLDFNQNAWDKTIASAYSIRHTGWVATPFRWGELATIDHRAMDLMSFKDRWARVGDLTDGIDEAACSLDGALALVAADEERGLGDAPWPPHYPKMPGEPPRVQPSKRRQEGREHDEGS